MKNLLKTFFPILLSLIFVIVITEIAFAYNESHATLGTILTNLSKFTAQNAPSTANATNRNVTVATLYGGWMTNSQTGTAGVVQNVNNFGVYRWTIELTNTGNITSSFSAKIVASNIIPGGNYSDWNRHFNNTPIGSLNPGMGTSFQFVISNVNPVANGSWVSYQIMVSNTSAKAGARTYQDAAGEWYGWNLGVGTNNRQTWDLGPVVYLQNPAARAGFTNRPGFLTLIISGPLLQISKSIQGVYHPSPIYSGGTNLGEPGAEITYRIFVTNAGSGNASIVKVIDTIPTSYVDFVSYTNGSILRYDSTASSTTNIIFTNASFNAGASDILKIRVRIK